MEPPNIETEHIFYAAGTHPKRVSADCAERIKYTTRSEREVYECNVFGDAIIMYVNDNLQQFRMTNRLLYIYILAGFYILPPFYLCQSKRSFICLS
jgi:hypothetical protein